MSFTQDARFLRACRGEKTDRPPVWLLRQAGRYMPEYLAVKAQAPDFLTFCKQPELTAQVTLDAQRILGVDAAILFADLPPLLETFGFDLSYPTGVGPQIANPLRDPARVDTLAPVPPQEAMPFVDETVRLVRSGLPADIPLIGFSGAPFTLGAYAIEGGGSRRFLHIKQFCWQHEAAWHRFAEHMTTAVIAYAKQQVAAGCQAFQLFDSWVGCLDRGSFRRWVLPYLRHLRQELSSLAVPLIYFGLDTAHLFADIAEVGFDVVGFDWHVPLAEAWQQYGFQAVQGNLDPLVLTTNAAAVDRAVDAVLAEGAGKPGFIFNVGHGLIPESQVPLVQRCVERVQAWSAE